MITSSSFAMTTILNKQDKLIFISAAVIILCFVNPTLADDILDSRDGNCPNGHAAYQEICISYNTLDNKSAVELADAIETHRDQALAVQPNDSETHDQAELASSNPDVPTPQARNAEQERRAPTQKKTTKAELCLLVDGSNLIAQDNSARFLGVITNKYGIDSIFNEYGTYGSQYQMYSIWNQYGDYGSKYGIPSPFNANSSTPPMIVKDGALIGYLTTNSTIDAGVSPHVLKGTCYAE